MDHPEVKRVCCGECDFAEAGKDCRKKCPDEEHVFCKILEEPVEVGDLCPVEYGIYLERVRKLEHRIS